MTIAFWLLLICFKILYIDAHNVLRHLTISPLCFHFPKKQDTVFCKSILNEFASKMQLQKPIYNTWQPQGLLPVFLSSLIFNGITYTGEIGRTKKEAEQLAARAVILSLMGILIY